MKKKTYVSPTVKTVMLQHKCHILAGSTPATRSKYHNGSQEKDEEEKDVTGNWVWD